MMLEYIYNVIQIDSTTSKFKRWMMYRQIKSQEQKLKRYIKKNGDMRSILEMLQATIIMLKESFYISDDWERGFKPPLNYSVIDSDNITYRSHDIKVKKWLLSLKKEDDEYRYDINCVAKFFVKYSDAWIMSKDDLFDFKRINYTVRISHKEYNTSTVYEFTDRTKPRDYYDNRTVTSYIQYKDYNVPAELVKLTDIILRDCLWEYIEYLKQHICKNKAIPGRLFDISKKSSREENK